MMGFPLQLPIDAMAARAVELTDWQGDIAGAGDHRGKALVIAVKSEAEAKALAAWISGIPVAVTVQKEQEKLHAAPFAVAGITPEMIADLIASLRDGAFELPAAMRDKSWAKESADQIMAVAANVIEQLEAQTKELGDFLAAYMAEAFTAGRTVKELTEAITRANAATAAAYEAAAQVALLRHDENQTMRATRATPKLTGLDDVAEEIRALAAPDQTAALDRMITVAEARVWEQAAYIGYVTCAETRHITLANEVSEAILAASKKGGA